MAGLKRMCSTQLLRRRRSVWDLWVAETRSWIEAERRVSRRCPVWSRIMGFTPMLHDKDRRCTAWGGCFVRDDNGAIHPFLRPVESAELVGGWGRAPRFMSAGIEVPCKSSWSVMKPWST